MDPADYKQANIHIALMANTIEAMPLEEVQAAQVRAETLGPFIDPTRFIEKATDLLIDTERTRILLEAQRKLKALREKVMGRPTHAG